MAKNHEISVYFSTNVILASVMSRTPVEIQNALVSKRRTLIELESCKQM